MSSRPPKYALHKPSGQAYVRIHGRMIYLGKHGSPESEQKYKAAICQWSTGCKQSPLPSLSIAQLCVTYMKQHAAVHYRKQGKQTSEIYSLQSALRPLVETCGSLKVAELRTRHLIALQKQMILDGRVRTGINSAISRILRVIKWAVEQELCHSEIYEQCRCINPLRRGRSEADESPEVTPIDIEIVERTKAFLSPVLAVMVDLQLLTGMRPGEVCIMRKEDITEKDGGWLYRPVTHKLQHHDKERLIPIGPKAMLLLQPFLDGNSDEYLFSPERVVQEQRKQRRDQRQSPMTPSQRARTCRSNAKRRPGKHYLRTSYATAIARACKKAGVPRWSPNQLRHRAATELAKECDLDTVRIILGHSTVNTTQIYAKRDMSSAMKAMQQHG